MNSSSDVGTDERLNRHVLAGSLFSGTGEQASGRVDVLARTISSTPQLQLELFVSSSSHWVGRLMSSIWNTMPLSHASSSTLHSSLGSVRMLSIWSGKGRCFGVGTRWKVSGLCGTRNSTCVPISVAVWVWAGSPRFLGNGCASLVAWVGAGRRGKVVSGVVRRGWAGLVAKGLTTLDSQATRGCPSILRKGY